MPSKVGVQGSSKSTSHQQPTCEMTQPLSEDDIYRTSTQYRLWSFSPESLAAVRTKTHELALERARRYAGQRLAEDDDGSTTNGHGNSMTSSAKNGEHILYLTVEEEARLVQRYCDQVRSTSDHFKWPVNVKVYASQAPSLFRC